jgi:glycosyltransferase involved in cell wall biosynthesis
MAVAAAQATATWYCVKGSNDTYWRVEVPAKAVGAKVTLIPVASGRQEIGEPGLSRKRSFRWYETEEGAEYPDHEGNAVFTRPDQARATHALAMKTHGTRIVAETDDNYFAPTEQNIAMRLRYQQDSRRLFRNALACFDALVTTTDVLRDQVWEQFEPKQRRNMEFHVCGNHVDPDHWPEPIPPREDGRLRIGWMGSDSHFRDIKLVYAALKWAADQGHEVVLIGYDPRWHPQCAVEGISGLKRGEAFGFPYTMIPWVDPAQFERPRVAWPLDIAFAPVERTQFNLGKSDVKFLEYSMSGAVTVASNIEVYSRSIRHGETGFLAGSPREFWDLTRQLCADRKLRERTVKAAVQYVKEERLISQHAHEWRDAISG